MSVCRSCGAPIVWITMESGKSMPCDAALVPFWEKPKAKGKVVTQDGRLRSCEFDGEPSEITDVGHIPHWATCPNAAQHKKAKARSARRG